TAPLHGNRAYFASVSVNSTQLCGSAVVLTASLAATSPPLRTPSPTRIALCAAPARVRVIAATSGVAVEVTAAAGRTVRATPADDGGGSASLTLRLPYFKPHFASGAPTCSLRNGVGAAATPVVPDVAATLDATRCEYVCELAGAALRTTAVDGELRVLFPAAQSGTGAELSVLVDRVVIAGPAVRLSVRSPRYQLAVARHGPLSVPGCYEARLLDARGTTTAPRTHAERHLRAFNRTFAWSNATRSWRLCDLAGVSSNLNATTPSQRSRTHVLMYAGALHAAVPFVVRPSALCNALPTFVSAAPTTPNCTLSSDNTSITCSDDLALTLTLRHAAMSPTDSAVRTLPVRVTVGSRRCARETVTDSGAAATFAVSVSGCKHVVSANQLLRVHFASGQHLAVA
ncbi:MAG: hypothetical protein Q8J97_13930, partial [Flavobacteriaceae bacterium]|nr:hypothetical protein [Flavobacteriaceae bacterium]